MSSEDQLAEQVERLADQQQKTADMLESLFYAYVKTNEPELRIGKMGWEDYWKAEPPWADD